MKSLLVSSSAHLHATANLHELSTSRRGIAINKIARIAATEVGRNPAMRNVLMYALVRAMDPKNFAECYAEPELQNEDWLQIIGLIFPEFCDEHTLWDELFNRNDYTHMGIFPGEQPASTFIEWLTRREQLRTQA